MRRISAFVYGLCNFLLRIVLRVVARWEVVGRENIPAEGPAILVCNHIHLVDPPLIGAASPRRLRPMAKRELFEVPLIGWFFWAYGAFPVRRFSADLGALRVAQGRLRQGEMVLMFPEGTRSKDGTLQPALPGAAVVALMSRVPIIPVAITGSRIKLKFVFIQWIVGRRPNIRVVFGKPFELSEFRAEIASAEQATDRMMRQVAALLPEEMRGAYRDETAGTVVVRRQGRNGRSGRNGREGQGGGDPAAEGAEFSAPEDTPSASSGGGGAS